MRGLITQMKNADGSSLQSRLMGKTRKGMRYKLSENTESAGSWKLIVFGLGGLPGESSKEAGPAPKLRVLLPGNCGDLESCRQKHLVRGGQPNSAHDGPHQRI